MQSMKLLKSGMVTQHGKSFSFLETGPVTFTQANLYTTKIFIRNHRPKDKILTKILPQGQKQHGEQMLVGHLSRVFLYFQSYLALT